MTVFVLGYSLTRRPISLGHEHYPFIIDFVICSHSVTSGDSYQGEHRYITLLLNKHVFWGDFILYYGIFFLIRLRKKTLPSVLKIFIKTLIIPWTYLQNRKKICSLTAVLSCAIPFDSRTNFSTWVGVGFRPNWTLFGTKNASYLTLTLLCRLYRLIKHISLS